MVEYLQKCHLTNIKISRALMITGAVGRYKTKLTEHGHDFLTVVASVETAIEKVRQKAIMF